MEELRVAVCEDSAEERNKLLLVIEESGERVSCDPFPSGESLLADYRAGKYDLIFMDIYMSGLSGVETVEQIRAVDAFVPIAFCTTSTDHALEGYRLDVLKYIEKPVRKKDVREMLTLARMKLDHQPRLRLKIDGQDVSVPFARISYLEQRGRKLVIFLTGGGTIQANERLDTAAPQFDGLNFYRCHKSYLVNLACIKILNRELMVFVMGDGKNVHIRRESLGEARKVYEAYLFSRARRTYDD